MENQLPSVKIDVGLARGLLSYCYFVLAQTQASDNDFSPT